MAVEIGKVTPVLDVKLKGKGFTKTYRDSLAKTLAAKIEKDEDIESYIDDRLDLILETEKEGDRRATQAAKTKEQEITAKLTGNDPEKPKQDDPKEPALPDGTPEWMKTFIQNQQKQMEALTNQLTGLQQASNQKSIAERLTTDERTKGIPKSYYEGWALPNSSDEFDAFADKLKTNYTSFATEHKLAGFGADAPPGNGGGNAGTGGKVKPASEDEVKEVMKNLI